MNAVAARSAQTGGVGKVRDLVPGQPQGLPQPQQGLRAGRTVRKGESADDDYLISRHPIHRGLLAITSQAKLRPCGSRFPWRLNCTARRRYQDAPHFFRHRFGVVPLGCQPGAVRPNRSRKAAESISSRTAARRAAGSRRSTTRPQPSRCAYSTTGEPAGA